MKKLVRRALAILLLPASTVPVLYAVPQIRETYRTYERNHESGPVEARPIRLTASARSLPRLPAHPKAVPVLVYRGVGSGEGAVDRTQLAHQLALLRRLGYRSISAAQYARFRRGKPVRMPARPVLLTFDRGLLSTYRQADRLLERTRMRATIFVATGDVQRKASSYLRWNELKDMQASGRWDVQTYGHVAGRPITIDAAGSSAPFYAARRFTLSRGQETLADFEQRAAQDVFRSKELLRDHGLHPLLFALPDRDYSAKATNDPRTLGLVDQLVSRQFAARFESADRDPRFSRATGRPAGRLLVDRRLHGPTLHRWLARRNPIRELQSR